MSHLYLNSESVLQLPPLWTKLKAAENTQLLYISIKPSSKNINWLLPSASAPPGAFEKSAFQSKARDTFLRGPFHPTNLLQWKKLPVQSKDFWGLPDSPTTDQPEFWKLKSTLVYLCAERRGWGFVRSCHVWWDSSTGSDNSQHVMFNIEH